MEINIDYKRYYKRNPETILEEYPKELYKGKEQRVAYLRARGLTYQEIADTYEVSRQYIEVIMNRLVVSYMKWAGKDMSRAGNER